MNKTVQVIIMLPYIALYALMAAFWGVIRFISGWVWAFEDYLIPVKYQRRELGWIIWLSQWPSLWKLEIVARQVTNLEDNDND